jgi:hypothetical protein
VRGARREVRGGKCLRHRPRRVALPSRPGPTFVDPKSAKDDKAGDYGPQGVTTRCMKSWPGAVPSLNTRRFMLFDGLTSKHEFFPFEIPFRGLQRNAQAPNPAGLRDTVLSYSHIFSVTLLQPCHWLAARRPRRSPPRTYRVPPATCGLGTSNVSIAPRHPALRHRAPGTWHLPRLPSPTSRLAPRAPASRLPPRSSRLACCMLAPRLAPCLEPTATATRSRRR